MRDMDEIIFRFPFYTFTSLGVCLLICMFWYINAYRKKYSHLLVQDNLNRLLVPRDYYISRLKQMGWILIWIVGCLALMDPISNIHYPFVSSNQVKINANKSLPYEIIFLIDTSASMGVKDASDEKSRLQIAQNIAEDILRQLEGETVSLYAFTSVLTPLVPPTLDYLFVRLAIKEVHLNEGEVGGTDFVKVLKQMNQEFLSRSTVPKTLIIMSDGGDTQLENLKGSEYTRKKSEILDLLNVSATTQVIVIGLGGEQLSPIPQVTHEGRAVQSKLESDLLIGLAKKLNGMYFNANEWNSLSLVQEINKKIKQDIQNKETTLASQKQSTTRPLNEQVFNRYFQFPLSIVLLIYTINLLLPDIKHD